MGTHFACPVFSKHLRTMTNLAIDSYERATIQAVARTGAVQYAALRDANEGKAPFTAQIRLLLELIRRKRMGMEDLLCWAERDRNAQP